MTYSTNLQAGSLNRIISIQQRSSAVDGFGQEGVTWTDVLTNVHAAVEPLSGTETVAAGAQIGEMMLQVVIRYRPNVVVNMRVLYEGRIFNILSVLDDFSRHRKLTMLCSAGLTRG